MRVFLAIELPQAVQARLAEVQRMLAEAGADVKWVHPRHLHLTIRFLGEIDEPQRHAVEQAARRVASQTPPISARVSGVGAFPSMRAPRVVWVGIEEGREGLVRLAERLEEALVQAGVQQEARPFEAHMTLGRVRSPRRQTELVERITQFAWSSPEPFVADQLTLFQSVLNSSGPTHTPLARWAFSAAAAAGA